MLAAISEIRTKMATAESGKMQPPVAMLPRIEPVVAAAA